MVHLQLLQFENLDLTPEIQAMSQSKYFDEVPV